MHVAPVILSGDHFLFLCGAVPVLVRAQLCMDVPPDTPLAALALLFFTRYSTWPWESKAIHFESCWNPDINAPSISGPVPGSEGRFIIVAPVYKDTGMPSSSAAVSAVVALWMLSEAAHLPLFCDHLVILTPYAYCCDFESFSILQHHLPSHSQHSRGAEA